VTRAIVLLAVLAVATVATADAISMPECTHGWTARYAGHSAYCAPHVCTSDAECGGGHCVDVARCFRTQPMDTGMVELPDGAPHATYEEPLDAVCAPSGVCAAGAHGAHEAECTEPPAHTGMCSMSTGRRPGAVSIALFGLVALVLQRRRAP